MGPSGPGQLNLGLAHCGWDLTKDLVATIAIQSIADCLGSVLGPILFIALTSDLVDHLDGKCVVKAYADDTQLLVGGRNRQEVKHKLEQVIAKAQDWFGKNSLLLNPTKTEIMMLGKRNRTDQEITVNVKEGSETIPLKLSSQIKILGVIIDEDLTWKPQISQVRKRATNIVRNLARTADSLPQESRRMLYDALVAPHFSYADIVWDGCLQAQKQQLQRTHNFAARTITGAKKFSSATEALKTLGMVPLAQKREIHQAVLAHKLVHGHGPKQLCNLFAHVRSDGKQPGGAFTGRLRSATNMTIGPKRHRTTKYEKSAIYRTTKTWNKISLETKTIEDTSSFKKVVQRELTHAHWGRGFSLRRP